MKATTLFHQVVVSLPAVLAANKFGARSPHGCPYIANALSISPANF